MNRERLINVIRCSKALDERQMSQLMNFWQRARRAACRAPGSGNLAD